MARSIWKRYRWDRIALVSGTFVLLVTGLVAWVVPDEASEQAASSSSVLVHPNAVQAMLPAGALPESLENGANPSVDSSNDEQAKPDEHIKPCSCNGKALKNIPRNPYTAHRAAARSLPNSFFVANKNELEWGKRGGRLEAVEDARGYHIAPLSHSHKVLLPRAHKILNEIGDAFADELEGTPSEGALIRITSLTRTDNQQNSLGKRNYNAIDDQSTHSYGASFDIAFTDRPNNRVDCSAATRAIEKVLLDFQRRGKILIITEGTCLHVTVRP